MVSTSIPPPLYDLATIQALARESTYFAANARARTKLLELGWKTSEIIAFLTNLTSKHYRGHYLQMSAYDGQRKLDCDAYKMCFDEQNLCEGNSTVDNSHCWFFVKLALDTDDEGKFTAIVSIHLDSSP